MSGIDLFKAVTHSLTKTSCHGTKKVAEKFKDKLYESFPDLYLELLTN